MSHPEFDDLLLAEIGDAVLRRLDEDPAIYGYFRAAQDMELETLRLGGSWAAPALFVASDVTDEEAGLSGRGLLTSVWLIVMVTPSKASNGTEGWLRLRISERIKAALARNKGQLLDKNGERLTESLIRFQRLGPPALGENNATLRTHLRVAFESQIIVATREFEP